MTKLIIDGKEWSSSSNEKLKIINPANEKEIATVEQAGHLETDEAISAAHKAFEKWKNTKPRERAKLLRKLAYLILDNKERLAKIEMKNVGKPITVATAEISAVAETFFYYSGSVDKFFGETIPTQGNGQLLTLPRPLGVVGLITPWNFPLGIASWKVAPALAAGNTVVLKPASLTPLSSIELGRLALEAGLPRGVLNVIPGSGSVVGNRIIEHPLVSKISFTGSTDVGSTVMKKAAASIKRISLELGGKSPSVIFSDAELDKAIKSTVFGVFENTGQNCAARSRIFVQESIYDEFIEKFVKETQKLIVGDPQNTSTDLGPMISKEQRETALKYIELGISEGAKNLTENSLNLFTNKDGYFLAPTILTNVRNEMRVAQEEIFGPVASIIKFKNVKEVIELANKTKYGLSASVWTSNGSRAFKMINNISSGVLSINSDSSVHLEAPFGGMKQSGIGRELGVDALQTYTEKQTVFYSYE